MSWISARPTPRPRTSGFTIEVFQIADGGDGPAALMDDGKREARDLAVEFGDPPDEGRLRIDDPLPCRIRSRLARAKCDKNRNNPSRASRHAVRSSVTISLIFTKLIVSSPRSFLCERAIVAEEPLSPSSAGFAERETSGCVSHR